MRFGNSAAGFGVCVQANVAVTAATCGVHDKPIARAVVAPALIVSVAFDVMAIEAVLAATEHDSASDPPFDPGVNTFTTWLPVAVEPNVVNVGPAASEAVGAVATGAAAFTTCNGVGSSGVKSAAPVPSHVLVVKLSNWAVGPTVYVPEGTEPGTVSVNDAAKIPSPAGTGVTPSAIPALEPAEVLGASKLFVPFRNTPFD